VSRRLLDEAPFTALRGCRGLRVNVFRAMYTPGVFLAADRSVLALRDGGYALTARVVFDVALQYFYVHDCHWYQSDCSRRADDEVPEVVRHHLLRRFGALLG
jgi:hypothetical protein